MCIRGWLYCLPKNCWLSLAAEVVILPKWAPDKVSLKNRMVEGEKVCCGEGFARLVLSPALPSSVSCGPQRGSPGPGRPHPTACRSRPPRDWDRHTLPLWLPGTLSGSRLLSVTGTKVKVWLESSKAHKDQRPLRKGCNWGQPGGSVG